jgi:hypothetical protein
MYLDYLTPDEVRVVKQAGPQQAEQQRERVMAAPEHGVARLSLFILRRVAAGQQIQNQESGGTSGGTGVPVCFGEAAMTSQQVGRFPQKHSGLANRRLQPLGHSPDPASVPAMGSPSSRSGRTVAEP